MNSPTSVHSTVRSSPRPNSSLGKRPVTYPPELRFPPRRPAQRPNRNVSLYNLIRLSPPLKQEQINMEDIDFPSSDLRLPPGLPFNARAPHIGRVSLERFLSFLPSNRFQRTRLALAQHAFQTAVLVYDRQLHEGGAAVLERFLELLASDSDGNTTVGEVKKAFCQVAGEWWEGLFVREITC